MPKALDDRRLVKPQLHAFHNQLADLCAIQLLEPGGGGERQLDELGARPPALRLAIGQLDDRRLEPADHAAPAR